jgi:outer membrane autotransporter protein
LSNGYTARLYGGVIGLDHGFIGNSLRLGFAGGYSEARIRSKDNSGHTRINGYQAGFSGAYNDSDKPYVLDAVLSYGYNDYDSSRQVAVGPLERTASSDYDGQQFSSYLEGGYRIRGRHFDITPLLALNYTYLHLDGYTENGAGALNLAVKTQNYDTLQMGTGFRLSHAFETNGMLFTPELRFRYFYSVINDRQQSLASFTGGGTAFETTGYRPAPSSFNIGARLEFFNKKNITVLADADTQLKDDYYEAGGSITFKYSF